VNTTTLFHHTVWTRLYIFLPPLSYWPPQSAIFIPLPPNSSNNTSIVPHNICNDNTLPQQQQRPVVQQQQYATPQQTPAAQPHSPATTAAAATFPQQQQSPSFMLALTLAANVSPNPIPTASAFPATTAALISPQLCRHNNIPRINSRNKLCSSSQLLCDYKS
jgi:hypothetical protein